MDCDLLRHTTTHPYADVSGPLPLAVRRDGSGPALLCIHGFPTASWDWAPLWPALTARFDTVAADLIGLGRSAKPARPLTIGLQADALEDLLVHLGLDEVHLFAHDLGDTVAQELLARQVDDTARVRVVSCVFLNGGLFPETHQPRLIQRLLLSPLGPLVAALSTERTFRRNMTSVFGPDTPPSDAFLTAGWRLLEQGGGRQMLPRLIRYMAERRTHRARWVQPLVDGVVPIRFIDGALDPVSGRHAANRFRQLVRDPDVVMLDHVGHYPHVEDPPAVLEAFEAFHDRLGAAG